MSFLGPLSSLLSWNHRMALIKCPYFLLKTEVHATFTEYILPRASGRRTNIVGIFSSIICGPNFQPSTQTAACHSTLHKLPICCSLLHLGFYYRVVCGGGESEVGCLILLLLVSILHGLDMLVA